MNQRAVTVAGRRIRRPDDPHNVAPVITTTSWLLARVGYFVAEERRRELLERIDSAQSLLVVTDVKPRPQVRIVADAEVLVIIPVGPGYETK